MRQWILASAGIAVVAFAGFWIAGGFHIVSSWAATGQEQAQRTMVGALRGLKGGQPGAWSALLGLCFAYGFFHAVGPGHGKVLIGGYGIGKRVPFLRLSILAIFSSLAQATTAVILVAAGVFVFDWTRETMTGLADRTLAQASYLAIALIGLWLLVRGGRRLWGSVDVYQAQRNHDHGHDIRHSHVHDNRQHGGYCETCGHAHGPTIEEAAEVKSVRDAVFLISGIAIRPCTGALFLLIICFLRDIPWAGIAGAYAMGLGTATITVGVALAAVSLREGALASVTESTAVQRLIPALEVTAGLLVALTALQLLLRAS